MNALFLLTGPGQDRCKLAPHDNNLAKAASIFGQSGLANGTTVGTNKPKGIYLMDEFILTFYVIGICLCVLLIFLINKNVSTISSNLILLAFFIFSYSWIHSFWEENSFYWIESPPPAQVLKIALVTILILIAIAFVKAGAEMRAALRDMRGFGLLALAIAAVSIGWTMSITVQAGGAISLRRSLAGGLAAFMVLVAIVVAATHRISGATHRVSVSAIVALTTITVAIGYHEVLSDHSFFRNTFVPGVIETRAASTFRNPNWFALGVVPAVFIAAALAVHGRSFAGGALAAIAAIGLVASGSRSVVLVAGCSLLLFAALCALGSTRRLLQLTTVLAVGGVIGVVAGSAGAALAGETAAARWSVLVERHVRWPVDLVLRAMDGGRAPRADGGALQTSIEGRLWLLDDTVDNAYLFLLVTSPPGLVLLLTLLLWIGWRLVQNWRKSRDVDAALRLSVFAFVALAGMIGQVYWTFPVWIILSVLVGWALAGRAAPEPHRK